MTEVVLDASAVLAVARNEPGADRVTAVRESAVLSAVNAAEVYAKLLTGGMSESMVTDGLRAVVRQVVPCDERLARVIGQTHARTRHLGLSLADCACLALGLMRGVPVLTTDRNWAKAEVGVTVEVIR